MSLTVALDNRKVTESSRGKGVITGTIAFDSSYPTGGESLSGITAYFKDLESIVFESQSGYAFEFDETNDKVKVYLPSGTPAIAITAGPPLLITEEIVTVTSNVGALANVPFYIVAIESTAGSVTGAFNIIPTGETAATKECAVTLTSGALTFKATDAVTSCRVTYIPLQTSGPFVEANRVIDESVTAAAAKATLANRACAVQYVYDDTDSTLVTFEPVGEAPSATHVCVLDITNGSSATDIDSHADDEANALKVTYIKYSALSVIECIGDGDLSLTSEAYNWTGTANYRAIVVPGMGTQFCGEETGAGNELGTWEGPSGTAANTVGTWDPYKNYLLTNNTNAIVSLAMPWFVLDASQVTLPTQTAVATGEPGDEVANTTDLSALTGVHFIARGRI